MESLIRFPFWVKDSFKIDWRETIDYSSDILSIPLNSLDIIGFVKTILSCYNFLSVRS